jgi:hypothetical protein
MSKTYATSKIAYLQYTSEKLDETFGTDYCNMCNIPIYFCNIHMKHLQHTSETIETYSCNMCFEHNISLLLIRMETRCCVVFIGGSGLTTLVGGGPASVATCHGRETSAARAAGRPWPRDLERATVQRTWQGRQPSAVTRRRPRAVLARAVPKRCALEAAERCAQQGQQPCTRRRQASR